MSGLIHLLIPLAALLYVGITINLVRKRLLSETLALIWILTFLGIAVSPFLIPLLDRLALVMGIYYSPTLYLLIGVFLVMSNSLANTIEISKLTDQNRRLTQEVSILRRQIESGERPPGAADKAGASPPPAPGPPRRSP